MALGARAIGVSLLAAYVAVPLAFLSGPSFLETCEGTGAAGRNGATWQPAALFYLPLAGTTAGIFLSLSLAANRRTRRENQNAGELAAWVTKRTLEMEKAAEERHRSYAGRMEALGRLADGMLHELNNVLVPILGLSEIAARENPVEGRLQQQLAALQVAAHRARDVVHQVMLFSRTDPMQPHPVLIAPVIREALGLAGKLLPSTIAIRTRIMAEDVVVMADEAQISRIVLCLIDNAADALGNGVGSIDLSLTERLVEGSGHAATGWLALTMQTGGASDVDRAATNEADGTDALMTVVQGIVASWGGSMKVSCALGQETSITVLLPAIVHGGEDPEMKTPPLRGASSL